LIQFVTDHRFVWRYLPRTPRRRLLLMITQAMASRPSRTPETSDRIIVVGLPSHLFRAGRGCQALLRGAARKRGCGCGNRSLSAHDAGPRRHRFRFQGWFKLDGRRDAHFTCQRALGSTCVVALGRRLVRGKVIGIGNCPKSRARGRSASSSPMKFGFPAGSLRNLSRESTLANQ